MLLGHEATIVGASGDDDLIGTEAEDVTVGFEGDDRVDGLLGDVRDLICGGTGADTLEGPRRQRHDRGQRWRRPDRRRTLG
jgi:Ca2+-binding RTX toxin-like protein